MRSTMSPRIEKVATTGVGLAAWATIGLAATKVNKATADFIKVLREAIYSPFYVLSCC